MSNGAQQTRTGTAVTVQQEESLLDKVLAVPGVSRTEEQRVQSRKEIATLAEEVLKDVPRYSKDFEVGIKLRIAELDKLISRQLNEIMHAPEFQKLEASWRGLHYLVDKTETSPLLKIKVLNVPQNELLKDLERAVEFDQSATFKKVHDEGFGAIGGTPFGALIGDYEFSSHLQDMELLEKMSSVAAAAHAPFIAAAAPELFNLDSFSELSEPRDLAKIFDGKEAGYIKWRAFREAPDSRYVGLTAPHILMRLPYGRETKPVETFNFEEDVDGKDHKKFLWGNAAYALATRLTNAFALYGWCTAIRGLEGGGIVEGLPTYTFRTDDGDIALTCPTEVAITHRRDNELSNLGFIPLDHYQGTDYAVFPGVQSCHKPENYGNKAANANANAYLSVQLQYMFATCRFAHYLKSICFDKVGTFMTAKNCEDFLNKWISDYVLEDDNAGQDLKAQYPLREARVDVSEVPGKPGVYKAVAFLRPHYQLDAITVALSLVAEVPARQQS